MGIFSKGINPGAYQGELTCPFVIEIYNPETHMRERVDCNSKAIRFVEHVTQYRLRYRCRKCGNTFQYDISGHHDVNPYAPYRKGRIWSAIEKGLDDIRRMQMLDKMSRDQRSRELQSKGVIL